MAQVHEGKSGPTGSCPTSASSRWLRPRSLRRSPRAGRSPTRSRGRSCRCSSVTASTATRRRTSGGGDRPGSLRRLRRRPSRTARPGSACGMRWKGASCRRPTSPSPRWKSWTRIIAWIENDFLAAQCGKQASSAPVVIRRLNRQEYNNTIRDLLGLDLHLADAFPAGRYRVRLRQRRLRAQHLARPCREVPRRRRARPAQGDRPARRRGLLSRRVDRPEDVSAPAERSRSSSSTP